MKLIILLMILIFLSINLPINCVAGGETSPKIAAKKRVPVFSTWEGFEVDKCASIWLIKRFIDKHAKIKFFRKGNVITEGIPFDVPEAKLRRYHNMSTFESILKYYNIQDPKLIYIGKIVHDIEVNIWEKKRFDETPSVQDAVTKIIVHSKGNDEVIRRSCEYFDFLYHGLSYSGPKR